MFVGPGRCPGPCVRLSPTSLRTHPLRRSAPLLSSLAFGPAPQPRSRSLGQEKKGEARSTRLRPSVEDMARATMRKTGLSRPDLYEFALILACPLAELDPTTVRHILVGHVSQQHSGAFVVR